MSAAKVDPAMVAAAKRVRALRVEAARRDPAYFCQFILRDEQKHTPVVLAPAHRRWHKLLNEHREIVIWGHQNCGKTHQIGIGRILWELGKNPSLRVVIVSKTRTNAAKTLGAIRQYIAGEAGPAIHEVFPRLRLAKNRRLKNNDRFLTIDRPGVAKDPTLQVTGEKGNIVGSRVDLMYIDDLLDEHNTRTQAPRETTLRWLRGNGCFGRLKGGRIWIVTNAWHPRDCNEILVREAGFYGERFPILNEKGESTWPEHWTPAEIEHQRERILGEVEFLRAMQCKPRDEDAAPFRPEWIDRALERGGGLRLVASLDGLTFNERPVAVYIGVDLAIKPKEAADLTAFCAIGVYANGDRRVLYLSGDRMGAPEILSKIKLLAELFPDAVWVVENNQAQDYIVQILHATTAINVVPFTTGSADHDKPFGMSKLGLELEHKKWLFPCEGGISEKTGLWVTGKIDRHMRALIAGLIGYDPTDHTSDYLMALWFAREGAVRYPCARALPEVGVETMAESPEERADREEREAFEQRRHRRAS